MLGLLNKIVLGLIEKIFFGGRKGLDNADEALRYLPIADEILKGSIKNPTILEVGSGSKGITPYIPFKITGVDIAFDGEIAANLNPICHSGTNLPFSDQSYDYVISVDMLEHVPSKERTKVISEMLRVANKRLFLAVPCGKLSEKHDRDLDELYLRERGMRFQFLKEHVENGLPTKEEIVTCINDFSVKSGCKIRIKVLSNVNLSVRAFFMRVWINPKLNKFYPLLSSFLCIFRRFLNLGNCYRQIFIIDIGD